MINKKLEKPIFKFEDAKSFLKAFLEVQSMDNFAKSLKIITLERVNNVVIECRYYSLSTNSYDIKAEMAFLIGGIHGFVKGDDYGHFDYYIVRAYDDKETELLYALTPYKNASFVDGSSIDWLKGSIFQENTNDYRLSVAKKQISEIENSLRFVVNDLLTKNIGKNWIDQILSEEKIKELKKMFIKETGKNAYTDRELLDYTFIHEIKDIIQTNWNCFSALFESKSKFEEDITQLNYIRRIEAHNRIISQADLENLKSTYNSLLKVISAKYSSIVPQYLIENWRIQVKSIMLNNSMGSFQSLSNSNSKLDRAISYLVELPNEIELLKRVILQLSTIPLPVQKVEIHNKLITILTTYKNLKEKIYTSLMEGRNEELNHLMTDIKDYEQNVMEKFLKEFLMSEG